MRRFWKSTWRTYSEKSLHPEYAEGKPKTEKGRVSGLVKLLEYSQRSKNTLSTHS